MTNLPVPSPTVPMPAPVGGAVAAVPVAGGTVPMPAAAVAVPQPAAIGTVANPVPGAPPAQAVSEWPEGALPEQSGNMSRSALTPAIYTFRLPEALARMWQEGTHKIYRKFLPNGQPNPRYEQDEAHVTLKFDKENPLVVEGGPSTGDVMLATFTSSPQPRPRWKRDEPTTPWISDLAYILEVCLGDASRPQAVQELMTAVNRHAGGLITLMIGRSGQCREDRVRYVPAQRIDPTTAAAIPMEQGFDTIQDPTGQKGCKKRYYTRSFKGVGADYEASIQCDPANGGCGAMIRGFESVEGFRPPV